MPDILLSNDELTVLGGPATINLEVDFGPQGDRGSHIYAVTGQPTSSNVPETPSIYDIAINIDTTDEDYLYYYQYINSNGTDQWVKLFRLMLNTYSTNKSVVFTDGLATINIPVIKLVPAELVGSVKAKDFNVQYSILNQNPIASSVSISEIISDGNNVVLPISIKATEYSSGSWSALSGSGSKTVHLFITMV
jgi:hypothetical protein